MLLLIRLILVINCLQGAETAEIKKAYRRLSMVYHPDRETGDPHKFMRITKAYNA
jgi:translocation protein SEC63